MAFRYRYKPKGQEYKKFVLTIVVIILISLIYLLYQNYYLPTTTTTTVTTTTSTTTTIPITKGELVIAFKHNTEGKVKLSSISLGTIANELNISITSLLVQNENDEWVSIFGGQKDVNLIDYYTNLAVIGKKEIDPGNYKTINLYINSGNIKIFNSNMKVFNKSYDINIPNKELIINHSFIMENGKTKVLVLEFDIPKSIPSKDIVVGTGVTYRFDPSCDNCITISEQNLEKGQLPENAIEI